MVGITGNTGIGKTTLLYSMLGHTRLTKGKGVVKQRGKLAFYPEIPYITNGSIKDNILMGQSFDATLYYTATRIARLNEDICKAPGIEDILIGDLDLSKSQLERIVIARAVYCSHEVFLFDNPLSNLTNFEDARIIFTDLVDFLLERGKTIVVATQNEEFLSKCMRLYRLEEEQICRDGTHSDFLKFASYEKMLQDYKFKKAAAGEFDTIEGSNKFGVNSSQHFRSKKSRSNGNTSSINEVNSKGF